MSGYSDYDKVRLARSAMKRLVSALMGLGYSEAMAIEGAEVILEMAEKDGLPVQLFWEALDVVCPIPKQE